MFADVGCSGSEHDLGEPIENLANLGPTSAAWLREAGIRTIADLERLGAVAACCQVKQRQPQASSNLLFALAAGLAGKDWRELTEQEQKRLRQEVESHGE